MTNLGLIFIAVVMAVIVLVLLLFGKSTFKMHRCIIQGLEMQLREEKNKPLEAEKKLELADEEFGTFLFMMSNHLDSETYDALVCRLSEKLEQARCNLRNNVEGIYEPAAYEFYKNLLEKARELK